MPIEFSNRKTDDTPYLWRHVYLTDGLEDYMDAVYSNEEKPLTEGIIHGHYYSGGFGNSSPIKVVVALYYNGTHLCGGVLQEREE